MTQDSGFESFISGDSGTELSQEQINAYNEQYRQAQQQQQQQQQQEQRQKRYDDLMGIVIKQLLGSQKNLPMLDVLLRLLKANVPRDFLLAIMSIGQPSLGVLFGQGEVDANAGSELVADKDMQHQIGVWTRRIVGTGLEHAQQVLQTATKPGSQPREANQGIIELTILSLQNAFEGMGIDVPPRLNLESFATGFYRKLWPELEEFSAIAQISERNPRN